MSEKKTETNAKTPEKKDELVEFTAPLQPGQERQELLVGVNGQFIRIRRGETVRIPKKFAAVIQNSMRQQAEAMRAH